MRILGFSLVTLFWLLLFFWLGTRFPSAFGSLPVIGKQMSQSTKFFLILLGLFIVFSAQKQHLSKYLKILFGK